MRTILLGSGWAGFVSRLGLLLLFPLVAGCGSGSGKVSGTVLFNGTPLPGGLVTFRPADPKRNTISVELDEQGNYEVVLPAGQIKVCIDNRELEPQPAAPPSGLPAELSPEIRQKLSSGPKPDNPPPKSPNARETLPGRYVKIPDKYYSIETSGLEFTVRGGEQKQNIELTR